jgi:hypothetical protein
MSRDEAEFVTGTQSAGSSDLAGAPPAIQSAGRSGHGEFTAILRRQRVPPDRLEDSYSAAFEIVCRDCGDRPDLDYSQVSPRLQRLRGPYPIEAGLAAYKEHIGLAN